MKVKALVWNELDEADGSVFSYRVTRGRNRWRVERWITSSTYIPFGSFGSKEKAKSAAQADYERRVMECLEVIV